MSEPQQSWDALMGEAPRQREIDALRAEAADLRFLALTNEVNDSDKVLLRDAADTIDALQATLAARDATIESLRAALAPFAAGWTCADKVRQWDISDADPEDVWCDHFPATFGDVRRAAALLDAPDRFDEAVPVDEFIANVRAKMEASPMADLSARWKAVLDVLRGEQVDATFCDLRLLATLIVAALDRLDAPCSECGGSGALGVEFGFAVCPSCGTGNEEDPDGGS